MSIAAGVTPELGTDPARFVYAAVAAGWPATEIWYDAESWTERTTVDVRRQRNVLTVSSFADPAATAARFASLCQRAA